MAVFTYINERGATGIILAEDIIGAAEVVGKYCNSDVCMRELEDEDFYGKDKVYEWDCLEHNEWPWLITMERYGSEYQYKICKRKDPDGTPWGDVEYSVSFQKRVDDDTE